jgi:hypothetical protein
MPITGHFEADFTQFNAGVKDATETVKKFGVDSTLAAKDLDKLGANAPAQIKAITAETKTATTSMFDLSGAVKQIGGMVAGAFTVNAIINFGFSVLETADNIGKLAAKTSMSTEEVQRLQFIADQSSVSMDALSGAAQQLQADLGSDNAGVVGAIGDLNINLDEFKKLSAYEQMLRLNDAVRGIEDPFLQARTAEDLFHKAWKEIYPAMKIDMEDLGKQAPVMADEYVKNLGRMKNEWDKFKKGIVVIGGEVISKIGEINQSYEDQIKLIEQRRLIEASADAGLSAALGAIPPLQKPVVQGFKDITLSAQQLKDQVRMTTDEATESMKKHQASVDATKAAYDALAGAFKKQEDEVDALFGKISGADAVAAAETWAKALGKMGDSVGTLSAKVRDDLVDALQAGIAGLATQGRLTDDLSSRFAALIVKVQLHNEALREVPPVVEAASGVTTAYTQKLYDEARAADAVAAATERANAMRAAMDAATGGGGGSGAIGYLPPRGSTDYNNMMGASTSGSGAGSSYYTPPRRAAGGPVSAGAPYMVGERGPELFVPGASGAIVPNGGGAVVYNTFHLVDSEANLARRVSDTILRTITSARRI